MLLFKYKNFKDLEIIGLEGVNRLIANGSLIGYFAEEFYKDKVVFLKHMEKFQPNINKDIINCRIFDNEFVVVYRVMAFKEN